MRHAMLGVVSGLLAVASLAHALNSKPAALPSPPVALADDHIASEHLLRYVAEIRPSVAGEESVQHPTEGRATVASAVEAESRKIPASALAATTAPSEVRGVATYYGIEDGFYGGTMYCGAAFSPRDPVVVAVSPGRYPCGTQLLVTEARSKQSIVVIVKDHCGGCDWNHLDLSRAAFDRLAAVEQGRLDIVWRPLR